MTYKQRFTGALLLRLARERYRLLTDRPEEDEEWLLVASSLVGALWVSGETEEAL